MKPNLKVRNVLAMAAVALAAGLWGACSADKSETPSAPPGPTVPSAPSTSTWLVSISTSPTQLTLPAEGSADPVPTSVITFDVRRRSDNTPAPTGLTVVATVTNGTLAPPATLCPGSSVQYCLPITNGQAVAVFTPTTAGTAIVTATVDGGNTAQSQIEVAAPGAQPVFLLSHVVPSVVDPAGGATVTIFGSNILSPVRVVIDGTQARVLSVGSGSIVVEVPPSTVAVPVGTTRPVSVTVTSGVGTEFQATDTLPNGITYAQGGNVSQPQVFSVTPTTGPQEGGTRITINGSGFLTPVQVLFLFGSPVPIQLEAQIVNATPTQITVLSPDIRTFVNAGTLVNPVTATIRVVNLNNGFAANAGQQFFYGSSARLTSIAPGEGSHVGGERVVITGNGFDEPLTVTIGGVGQQVVSVTGTQIVIRTVGIPNAACGSRTPFPVVVTMVEGGASVGGVNYTYIGPPNPRIFGVTPTQGSVGSTVTILGDGFQAPVRVLFGGVDGSTATVTSVTPTTITAIVPTAPPGFQFDTEPCDGDGDGNPGGTRLIPTRISITVINIDSGCQVTLANAYTLNPPNTTCTGDTTAQPTPTPTPTPTPAP
jgi:hypothetical protein